MLHLLFSFPGSGPGMPVPGAPAPQAISVAELLGEDVVQIRPLRGGRGFFIRVTNRPQELGEISLFSFGQSLCKRYIVAFKGPAAKK
jgi:hypothetical protein